METDTAVKLYAALYRTGRQLHRFSHRMGYPGGYYREQTRLLLLISENDGVIQRDLAEEMDVRPSSMTEMLAKMEQLGLITRKQDEKDQRVMHIYLTDQGKTAVDESRKKESELTGTLFSGLTEEETSEMLRLTEKLVTHLDEMDSAALEQDMPHGHHRGFCRDSDRHGHHHDRMWHHHGFSGGTCPGIR